MTHRLGIFVTHPIQYFAPLWKRLADSPDIDVTVHFFSDQSVAGRLDAGFGVNVAWDTPLLHGYHHRFLSRTADLSKPSSIVLHAANRYLRRSQFDSVLVHGYINRFERQVISTSRRLGIRTLMRGEMTDVPRPGARRWKMALKDAWLRRLYENVDGFCVIGELARRHLENKGVGPERMFWSPYSVDTEFFGNQAETLDRVTCRQELGVADDEFALVFSGKLIPRKEPLLLLEALRRLPKDRKAVLIVLGDGPQREEVLSGIQNLTCRTVLPGFVNQTQLGKYYRAADAFVLPSNYETWGLVANEAMQFGLPVIASSMVGSTHDLIEDGVTGLIFPSGDAAALSNCIFRLIADPEATRGMGRQGREKIGLYSTEESARGIEAAVINEAWTTVPMSCSTHRRQVA